MDLAVAMRLWSGIVVALGLAGPGMADICGPGARVDYPLSAVLELEAQAYSTTAIMNTDFDALAPVEDAMTSFAAQWPAYVEALAARSAELPVALADLPYLIVLNEALLYPDPFYSLTYLEQSAVLPRIIEAAERQGLSDVAKLLRLPMIEFPNWQEGPDARNQQSNTRISGPRRWAMQLAAASLHQAAPDILAAAETLIASDPVVAAEYEARRRATDDGARLSYLTYRLLEECEGILNWWSPDEADLAFDALAGPQRDILLLHFFLAESFNGSSHQYFFNSSGTMAPQLAEALDRHGLPSHARAVRAGMAAFPGDYPRDTDARRDVMAGFTGAQDDLLYALTVWADDGLIDTAMVGIANRAGLMPR
jgi:Domain of unknown function (DUF4375)